VSDERLIKSARRVKEHGEVFTPQHIVKLMLDQEELKPDLNSLTATFLEPAAGEGAFLTEILRRKLRLARKLGNNFTEYEENALLALSSLYGIELLEDNVELLAMNMLSVFYQDYLQVVNQAGGRENAHVLESAKIIISANMAQGDALTQTTKDGSPIVFSEWQLLSPKRGIRKVQRTEYTLVAIMSGGTPVDDVGKSHGSEQLDLFGPEETLGQQLAEQPKYRYVPVRITDVYKQLMEEV
jgi:hypothetical protein